MNTPTRAQVRDAVRDRYARAATSGSDCCEPSCCGSSAETSATDVSRQIGYGEDELAAIPDEANLGLGCGNPTALADLRPGQTVLDLGSGAGIDCFLAARQVGPTGHVIGVDMTHEMITRAREGARKGGYPNVEFRLGEIEALPVADGTVDVIISNCVLNLSTNRGRVLEEAMRVLRPGGRVVVSDLVSDEPVPEHLVGDVNAVAGCLPTLRDQYIGEFEAAGFTDVRISHETRYPDSYILSDAGVIAYLEGHPEQRPLLERFARSISGAHFEARKPAQQERPA